MSSSSLMLAMALMGTSTTGHGYAQPFEGGVPIEISRSVDERRFAARPIVLEARLGTGTIVGNVGATVSYNPLSFLGIGAGAGVNPAGFQVGGLIALRPLTFVSQRSARLHGIGLELGYSTGPYNNYQLGTDGGGGNVTYSWDRVHWLEPLVFYQTQSHRGFNLLAGIGAAIPLAKHGYHCEDIAVCGGPHITGVPTVTVGLGYAFDVGG